MQDRFNCLLGALAGLYLGACPALSAQAYPADEMAIVEMPAYAVAPIYSANEEPATGFATAATRLRYAPEIDLQSRGLPEAQSDLVVRGGVFEQTGLMLGAIPLFDPQTGHYTAEVPFAPAMLTGPRLQLGSRNAVDGFNANLATVQYGWSRIESGGELSLGFGSDAMQYQSLYYAVLLDAGKARWSMDFAGARAEGDGTLEDGDYRMKRFAGRLQRSTDRGQTDFYLGYLDKFYGWPGLYIGNAFGTLFPETDDYQTAVFGINHRQAYGNGSFWEASAAHREVEDDYEVNREAPTGDFEHRTRASTAGFKGEHVLDPAWRVGYHLTVLRDRLVRSSSLIHGDVESGNDFTSRDYLHLAIAPEYRWRTSADARWSAKAGLTGNATSEDKGHVGWLLRLEREALLQRGSATVFLDFSQSSQVPGYTALRSSPGGLFGGNARLGREYATKLEIGARWEAGPWILSGSIFGRYDDDLVDWTFSFDAPNARQANPVEVENFGTEWIVAYTAPRWKLQASYTYLNKDADYREAAVDASFYVLNHARHRLTLSSEYRLREDLDLRLDASWRQQVANVFRRGGEEAFRASLSLYWRPLWWEGIELSVLADNLTDSDFQDLPGTPAVGRHVSARVTYRW